MLKHQGLRILAATGAPLDLTTQHQGATQYTVHAKDRGSFQIFSQLGPDEFAQWMASELRYYPDSVTLNGEPVKTTPFPDLANVTVTSFQQHTTKYPDAKQIALGDSSQLRQRDALIAGVLYNTFPFTEPQTYFTPGESKFAHWQPALRVTVTPVAVVTPEEYMSLTQTELQLLLENNEILPLTGTVAHRGREQIQRTISHPNAPPEYTGRIHNYTLSHPDGLKNSPPFNTGEPIIVHRTPVGISGEGLSNPEYISVAEALYTTDQELVPVSQENNPEHTVTYIELVTDISSPPDARSCLQPTRSITISISLDKHPAQHRIPARLWMNCDEDTDELENIFHIPGALDKDYLANCLVRAYWTDRNCHDRFEEEEQLADLVFEMNCLAKAAAGQPEQAYQELLQDHLDRFSTYVPGPETECTATSPDGTITMTYRPPQKD